MITLTRSTTAAPPVLPGATTVDDATCGILPTDGDILLEVAVGAGSRSGVDRFAHFVPVSIERNEAGSGGAGVRRSLTGGEPCRCCVRIIGGDQY